MGDGWKIVESGWMVGRWAGEEKRKELRNYESRSTWLKR